MLMGYRKLRANKVEVFSVKTDAFTILSKGLEKAKTILNFGDEMTGDTLKMILCTLRAISI